MPSLRAFPLPALLLLEPVACPVFDGAADLTVILRPSTSNLQVADGLAQAQLGENPCKVRRLGMRLSVKKRGRRAHFTVVWRPNIKPRLL